MPLNQLVNFVRRKHYGATLAQQLRQRNDAPIVTFVIDILVFDILHTGHTELD